MTTREIAIGSVDFRTVMGHFCTGVVIVTAIVDEVPVGMTCQSFMSVSLDPPLISICPAHTSTTWPKIRSGRSFGLSVLALDQQTTCEKFARAGEDRYVGVGWSISEMGNPVLDGCLAHLDCTLEAAHVAGDHDIVVGHVEDLRVHRPDAPLLFFKGQFTRLVP